MIMVAIWLFLVGVARIATGRFTPAEVILTVVIAAFAACGIAAAGR